MIVPVSGYETLLYKTVRFLCEKPSKEGMTIGFGTGFFYLHHLPNSSNLLLIVTNKHVVEGATRCTLCLHIREKRGDQWVPSGKMCHLTISDGVAGFINHPDPEVDLCAVPFVPIQQQLDSANLSPYMWWLTDEHIPSDDELAEFDAVEEAYMIGYPNGLWDEVNNFPIIRRGVTATHPGVRFNGKSVTVVDMACIPGSSGSPVVIIKTPTRAKHPKFFEKQNLMLLGVLFAGPMMSQDGRIEIRQIPTAETLVASTLLPINLGYVVKAREVRILVEHLTQKLNLCQTPPASSVPSTP